MKIIIAALVAVLLIPPTPAQADTTPPSVLIYGDSITSRYNDIPGDPDQGWWSMIADDMGMEPVLSAEGGSGLVRKGNGNPEGANCSGTRFMNRREHMTTYAPNVVLIEVGRNDIWKCNSDGTLRASTNAEVTASANEFFWEIAHRADALWGYGHRNLVYVFTPWGYKDAARRSTIRSIIKTEAMNRGFQYVSLGYWDDPIYTTDGTHPSTYGSGYFYRQLRNGTDLDTRFD